MERRLAGRDGLRVTPVGLGLAGLGRPGYINLGHDEDLGPERGIEKLRDHAHGVLDAAYRAGVRYFDAARSYGLAEDFLASWLDDRDVARDEVTVASKWGYAYTADWQVDAETHEVKDHSAEALDRQLAESRQTLGDRLALYQIHSATLETGVLADERVLAKLAALADEGVRVGFTVSGPRQSDVIRQGLRARVDGRNPFSAVQVTWNLLEPSAGAALGEAHEAGWVTVIKEGVANGRLTSRNGDPAFLPKLRTLQTVAQRHGVGVDAVALACVLAQPFTDVVLSGASTGEQLESNVNAVGVTLSDDEAAALSVLYESPDEYWAHRSALPWR